MHSHRTTTKKVDQVFQSQMNLDLIISYLRVKVNSMKFLLSSMTFFIEKKIDISYFSNMYGLILTFKANIFVQNGAAKKKNPKEKKTFGILCGMFVNLKLISRLC